MSWHKIKKLFGILGPGFVTGSSDDDPSAIGTFTQTGAEFGYNQLWTALFSFPFLTAVQEIAGRIGMVTGKGLSAVVRSHYPPLLLYGIVALLAIANVIFIGADLGAMAASAQLLLNLPFTFWLVFMALFTVVLEIFSSYRTYARFLKYLAFTLLASLVAAFVINQDWTEIGYFTVVPRFSADRAYLLDFLAIVGTRASPYMFFWQPSQEVEEEIEQRKISGPGEQIPSVGKKDIRRMRVDTTIGMFFSGLIMFFIIITAASTLGAGGITKIETAAQAARALAPLAGKFTSVLFAAGILGAGLLTIPILAGSAAYALSDAIGCKSGLNKPFAQAYCFYGIIIAAILGGMAMNFFDTRPFRMLYYAGIINGLIVPPLMVLIMLISNNKRIMGIHTNSRISNFAGWTLTGIVAAVSLAFLFSLTQ